MKMEKGGINQNNIYISGFFSFLFLFFCFFFFEGGGRLQLPC